MLYDPKWEIELKPIFSFERLIAWLEQQPCDGTYDFTDPSNCMTAQYLKAHGVNDYCLDCSQLDQKLPGLRKVAKGWFFGSWTFGLALARAKAELSNRK